jgi:very-short-patch-repair endonuclease
MLTASVQTASGGKTHQQMEAHLDNLSGSTLEKAFLAHLKKFGHHLPDDAQVLIEQFKTRPDFIYKAHQAVVYIDGPHHENPAQKNIDDQLTAQLQDAGLTVIRLPKEQNTWAGILAKYPDIFGAAQ